MCRQDASSRNMGCIIILFITLERTQPARAGAVGQQAGIGLPPGHTKDSSAGVPTACKGTSRAVQPSPLQDPPSCQTSPTPGNTEMVQQQIQHGSPKGSICSLASSGKGRKADRDVEGPPALSTPCSQGPSCATVCSAKALGHLSGTVPVRQHLQIPTAAAAVHGVPAKALVTGPDHLLVLRQNLQAEEGGFRQLDSTGIKKWRSPEESGSFEMSPSYSVP